jgi:hypothetical protein
MAQTWKRCTQARYWDMLEILPPAVQKSHGFLVGEPYTHRTCRITGRADQPAFSAFLEHRADFTDSSYLEGSEPMTIAEFNALQRSDVLRSIVDAVPEAC